MMAGETEVTLIEAPKSTENFIDEKVCIFELIK